MSTLKKHLTSNVNHALPTYKKLPPIQTPPLSKDKDSPKSHVYAVRTSVASPPLQPGAKGQKVSPTTKMSVGRAANERQEAGPLQTITKKSSFKASEDATNELASDVKLTGFRPANTGPDQIPDGTGWTPLGTEIPPCRICGDKASGLHYGVYTCEACKAFFRRILKRKTLDFQCTCTPAEKKLGISVPRKTLCQKCRYDRCIKEGMSKDAIKIGRYTITRKRQNDREVKMLRSERRLSEGSSKSTSSASPYSGYGESSPEDASQGTASESTGDGVSTAGKRQRKESTDDDGQLFQSLTNSIFQSLLQNKQHNIPSPASREDNPGSETSLLEKLYKQPFNPRQQEVKQAVTQNSVEMSPGSGMSATNEGYVTRIQVSGESSNPFLPAHHVIGSTVSQMPNPFLLPQKKIDISALPQKNMDMSAVPQNAGMVNGLPPQFTDFGPVSGLDASGILSLSHQNPSDLMNDASPIESLLTQPVKLPLSVDSGISDHDNLAPEETTNFGALPLDDNPMTPNIDLLQDDQFVLTEEEFPSGAPVISNMDAIPGNASITTASKLDYMPDEIQVDCYGKPVEETFDLDIEDFLDSIDLDIDSQMSVVERYKKPVLSVGNGISVSEINEIVSQLTDSSMSLYMDKCTITCEEIQNRHAAYLEQYQLKMQLFGDMSKISKEEYFEFYNQTGIDIDNRQQLLIEALKHFEDSVGKLVKFAKCIPGFTELDVDDQVNLLKDSRFAYDMIQSGRWGSCLKTKMVTTTPWNKDYHIDEIEKIFPKDYLQMKMEFAKRIYNLGMSMVESIIARAVAITFYSCCSLKEPAKVEVIHHKMVACLQYHLNERPADKPLAITDIIYNLISLKGLVKREKEVMQELFETWPISSNHKLVKEFVM